MAVFCVDLGGTKSRAALYDAQGQMLAQASTGPGAASLGTARAIGAVEALWAQLTRDKAVPRSGTVAVLGVAGIGLPGAVAELRGALSAFDQTICVNDGYGALLDATGGTPGLLVMVGTGVAALRLDGDGQCHVASGWGFPGGDLGGGAWIGLQAVGALTTALDALPCPGSPSANLTTALKQVTGQTAAAIMEWITTARATEYARLAPIIAASDDPAATAIMTRAGHRIANVARGLSPASAEAQIVHLSGGLAASIIGPCAAAAPDLDWRKTATDPLRGLWLLATGAAPPERLAPRAGMEAADYLPDQ